MPVVEQYWTGVLQRLQAEVEVFSKLVGHQGEKGRANELAFANLLGALLPRRFGIGTGMVIDHKDGQSSQMDIVVFEQSDQPTLLAQTTQLLHPVETVHGCVEVKTTLATDDLKDFVKKRASLTTLEPLADHGCPLFLLLAYNSGIAPKTLAKWLAEAPAGEAPDLVCVIGDALIGSGGDGLGAGSAGRVGRVLLQERDSTGNRLETYVLATQPTELTEARDGRLHPVVDHDGSRYLAEPARALLLFVEALLRLLGDRGATKPSVISGYVGAEARQLAWIAPA
jgi:hypothetical protein